MRTTISLEAQQSLEALPPYSAQAILRAVGHPAARFDLHLHLHHVGLCVISRRCRETGAREVVSVSPMCTSDEPHAVFP